MWNYCLCWALWSNNNELDIQIFQTIVNITSVFIHVLLVYYINYVLGKYVLVPIAFLTVSSFLLFIKKVTSVQKHLHKFRFAVSYMLINVTTFSNGTQGWYETFSSEYNCEIRIWFFSAWRVTSFLAHFKFSCTWYFC